MIEIINIDNPKWKDIIDNNLVHFTQNYCHSFKECGDGEPILFYLQKNESSAYQVMFKRKIETSIGEYYDLISPYGYGGWIINGEYDSSIFTEYIDYCLTNNIICEFERFDLFRTDISKYYGNIKFVSHNVVKLINLQDELIFEDMERRVKKNIRKAIKNELQVIIDENMEQIYEFKKIYYSTMDRNNASNSYYFNDDFFSNLTKESCKLFHVKSNEKIISTELIIYDKLCCYSYLGGTLNEYFSLRPNEIMKYEIMKWGHAHGLKYFVLGGGLGGDDGIFNYKKGLAPNGIYNFFIGNKIFNQEVYDQLCNEKGVDDSVQFFPKYRSE